MTKRVAFLAVLALAAPPAASAKGPIAVSVCGATSCVSLGTIDGNPFSDGRTEPARAAAPGPYYRIRLVSQDERWSIFYVASGDVLALPYRGWVNWEPLEGIAAPALRRAVRRLVPLSAPALAGARADGRALAGGPDAYLGLLGAGRRVHPPDSRESMRIELTGPASPWTNVELLYFPGTNVVQRALSDYVRVDSALAARLEGSGGTAVGSEDRSSALLWPVLAVAACAVVLLAAVAGLRRRRAAPQLST